ncbi:MAG: polymer-forming cytoskeletal protein [FCB group bacterium]|nr:polymer-forming cytoskeletal protein [FCB group bacterium]
MRIRQNNAAGFALMTLACIMCLASVVSATVFTDGNRYFVPVGDTINDDVFAGVEEGVFDGVIAHDLFIGAKKYIVSGEILGNINSGSQFATIRGQIGNSARVFAQNIIIDGTIENNLLGFGEVIDLSNSSRIGNDVALFGSEVSVSGDIDGDLLIHGGQIIISGKIEGDVELEGRRISIVAPAEITGDISYKSRDKIKIDDDVILHGEVDWDKIKDEEDDTTPINWLLKIVLFLCALITGLILLPLCSHHTKIAAAQIIEKPVVCIGVGFIAICIAPVAFVILAVTVIGAPAAIILLFAFTIFFYIAKIYVAIALGRLTIRAFRKGADPKNGWSMILGLIILMILFSLPTIGWILYFATVFFGIGAILIGIKRCREMALSAIDSPCDPNNDKPIA